MEIRFLLVCEGSSDTSLVDHIERLLVDCGASEASGTASCFGRKVGDKIRTGLQYYGEADLLVVHRDANSAGAAARYDEIANEVGFSGYRGQWVGIVPVRAMEAWLLVDEDAIRRVAGRPNGTESLDLPKPQRVEAIGDPKEVLRQALFSAAAPKGKRRRKKVAAEFSELRRQIAERLPIGGALEKVPSWERFRADVKKSMELKAAIQSD